jgi:uncharacterized protein YlxP (DUF503 family)
MYVGIARLGVVIGESHSLKEKRMVLRRIKDRVRERLGVIVNEVGHQDSWQSAELGCAVVSADAHRAASLIDDVVRVAMSAGGTEIASIERQMVRFEGVLGDLPTVDDRTGSGDKAAGAQGDDAWVPDEWKQESES